jgi:phosphatidylinositol N-acetylglucosaminyltransferase subunit H
MRNTQCSLRIYRPTPTTVSFTVSTRSPHSTYTAQAFHYTVLALRAIVCILILALLYVKWTIEATEGTKYGIEAVSSYAEKVENGKNTGHDTILWVLQWAAQQMSWRYLLPMSGLGLWVAVRRGYTKESLLVLRGLGVQTSTSSSTYLSTETTRFIPTTAIQDIFIHEAFKGFEVRYYLAIVVKGEDDVVVVFPVGRAYPVI